MRLPIQASGFATITAGLFFLPRVVLHGWQSAADVGSTAWEVVFSLGAAHHVLLVFGLFGIYATAVRPAHSGALGAFVVASAGNALMIGVGAVLLTVLPALAAHPTASSGLDCTPFFPAATASAAELINRACSPWHFDALFWWLAIGRVALLVGSIWLALEITRARALPREAAMLLALGWAGRALGLAVPLPEIAGRGFDLVIAVAWIWLGIGLVRLARR